MSSASAQIGIKGGIGVSDIAFKQNGQTPYLGYEINYLEHKKPALAYEAGVSGFFELGKRFDFQPELLFAMQGLDYSTEYLFDDITYKINISYLKIPLLFRYKICIKETKQSGFILGPYTAWKLNAVRITEFEGQKEKNNVSNVKDFDFGIIGGYSLDFGLFSGRMLVDLRCGFSLVNIMEPLDGYIPWYFNASTEYVRNVNISITVGYRFLNVWSKNE